MLHGDHGRYYSVLPDIIRQVCLGFGNIQFNAERIALVINTKFLRFAMQVDLAVPFARTFTSQSRSFVVVGPTFWNRFLTELDWDQLRVLPFQSC